jgi:hypothetical protein
LSNEKLFFVRQFHLEQYRKEKQDRLDSKVFVEQKINTNRQKRLSDKYPKLIPLLGADILDSLNEELIIDAFKNQCDSVIEKVLLYLSEDL